MLNVCTHCTVCEDEMHHHLMAIQSWKWPKIGIDEATKTEKKIEKEEFGRFIECNKFFSLSIAICY